EFVGPSGSRYDFDRFIDLGQKPPRTSRETIDGHDCIRLTLTFDTPTSDEWSITFWHDVHCNYLIRKEVARFGRDVEAVEYEILDFAEPAPGVFVPIRCRLRVYDKGKLRGEEMWS